MAVTARDARLLKRGKPGLWRLAHRAKKALNALSRRRRVICWDEQFEVAQSSGSSQRTWVKDRHWSSYEMLLPVVSRLRQASMRSSSAAFHKSLCWRRSALNPSA